MFDSLLNIWNKMWKSNWSYFWSTLTLVGCVLTYLQGIDVKEGKTFCESINWFIITLYICVYACVIIAIIVKRLYIPRAKKKKIGIAFYINNAADKQYKAINEQFINPFVNLVNKETNEFDIIVIDNYHSKKYYSELARVENDNGVQKAKILNKRRCRVAILINCISGGDKESIFCSLESRSVVVHEELPATLREMLRKDISTAFDPLNNIKIYYETQSQDFIQLSKSLNVVFKYILSTTYLHCGYFALALNLLKVINTYDFSNKDLSAVSNVGKTLSIRIGFCNMVIAEYEYQCYLNSGRSEHLCNVRKYIRDPYAVKHYCDKANNLEGICYYLLDKNIESAIVCMDKMTSSKLIARFNKVFLMIYKSCTVNNVYRALELYKRFSELDEFVQTQIENFICSEYKKDETKKQLLLLLFLIFDYQSNSELAKQCLNLFCDSHESLVRSVELSKKFDDYHKKYKNVEYDKDAELNI